MRRGLLAIGILGLLVSGGLAPAPAHAFRPLLSEAFLKTTSCDHCGGGVLPMMPPPEGELEDPCGLAISPAGDQIYVADYYHRAIDSFSAADGSYGSQMLLPGGSFSGLGRNELDSVCGLAIDSSGDLYANEWHQGVVRLAPSEFSLDSGGSTGVAVDAAGDVFVDDRTSVTEYAAPVQEGAPVAARIGEGSLGDAYGIAVSPAGDRVYLADASSGEVKMFEPAHDTKKPVASFAPPLGFTSLVDSALAIDPTDQHLLVLDNLQPGYERPEVAVDEFESGGAFVGQVTGPASAPIINGEPSGLAVDSSGDLFVTDGKGELGNALKFGPDPPGEGPVRTVSAEGPVEPRAEPSSDVSAPSSRPTTPAPVVNPKRSSTARASNVVQHGKVRVAVDADISPRALPRQGTAPIHFSLDARISSTDGSVPPQLRTISVEINRNGHLDPTGLPICSIADIQPATTEGALAACRDSLVGEGSFAAKVLIASQAPFPSSGKILAFNGRWHGRPAILAHIYGTVPVPTSYTLPFVIGRSPRGDWGATLSASLPGFTSQWGYVTGIALYLGRVTGSLSYLTASCPAPPGFPGASFPLARASFSFAGSKPVSQTLTRTCKARG